MYRVVCPVCKAGFEAKFSRENCAINCVTCGVAFNASHYLPKAESGGGRVASPIIANVPKGLPQKIERYTGPVLVDPPKLDAANTNGLPLIEALDADGGIATLEPPKPQPKQKSAQPQTPLPTLSKQVKKTAQQQPAVGHDRVQATIGQQAQSAPAKPAEKSDPANIAVQVAKAEVPKNTGPVLKAGPVIAPGPILKPVPQLIEGTKDIEALPGMIGIPTPAPLPKLDEITCGKQALPRSMDVSRHKKSSRRPLLEGSFGKYDIEGEIARGGVGAVFRARERDTGKPFALKVLLDGDDAGETERERFRHECETAKALSLPGMVQIHEVGELEGRPYMAMELVEGKSLDRVILEKSLSVNDCLVLMKSVAETVGALHEAGYVHRDLKPGNILLDTFGSPKVADFGLVKSLDEVTRMTASGLVCGTPAYMSPEQARGEGKNVDPRSDVWALGAVLYEMLAGEPPFKADNALKLMLRITKEQPRKLTLVNRKVPKDVEAIVTQCLDKKPAQRYANGRALAADIAAFLEGGKLKVSTQPKMRQFFHAASENRGRLIPAAAAVAAIVLIALIARLAFTSHDAAPIAERGFQALNDATLSPAEKLNRAERSFREALLLNPNQARASLGLGLCLARRGIDPQSHRVVNPALVREAFKYNDTAAQLDPKLQSEALANSARYNMWMADHVAEASQLERAVKLEPRNLKYRESLGMAYWNAGAQTRTPKYYQSAIVTFETILNSQPDYPKVAGYIRQIQDKFLAQHSGPAVGMAEGRN